MAVAQAVAVDADSVLKCGPDMVVVESDLCHAHTVCHAHAAGKTLARLRWQNASESDRERLRTLRSKVTPCRKCGVACESARVARVHCRG